VCELETYTYIYINRGEKEECRGRREIDREPPKRLMRRKEEREEEEVPFIGE
jgi:hypothetical protein